MLLPKLLTIIYCLTCALFLSSQHLDEFNGPFVDNIHWQGDYEDFIIESGRLQLNATGRKSRSILYRNINIPKGNYYWKFDFELKFNPSRQNKMLVWLITDHWVPEEANGIAISIGSNGDNDAIEILEYISGIPSIIGSGILGNVALNPSGSISVFKDSLGFANLKFISDQTTIDSIPFLMIHEAEGIFMYDCQYTVTRSKSFSFDNFYCGPLDYSPKTYRSPRRGEIVINEILFNPRKSGSDFLEIINVTEDTLSLNNISILNNQNSKIESINNPAHIMPLEILVFTENVENIIEEYPFNSFEKMYEQNLPSFNNDNGNATLMLNTDSSVVVDSYDYDEDQHFILLDDTEGISLERIDPRSLSSDATNWSSASSLMGFGTPGLTNSVHYNLPSEESFFEVINKVFSPNGDGYDDYGEVTFTVPPKFVGNAWIFDIYGNEVFRIWHNNTLPTNGKISWTGMNENDKVSPIGIYILLIEIFNSQGAVIRKKFELVIGEI